MEPLSPFHAPRRIVPAYYSDLTFHFNIVAPIRALLKRAWRSVRSPWLDNPNFTAICLEYAEKTD